MLYVLRIERAGTCYSRATRASHRTAPFFAPVVYFYVVALVRFPNKNIIITPRPREKRGQIFYFFFSPLGVPSHFHSDRLPLTPGTVCLNSVTKAGRAEGVPEEKIRYKEGQSWRQGLEGRTGCSLRSRPPRRSLPKRLNYFFYYVSVLRQLSAHIYYDWLSVYIYYEWLKVP